MLLISELCFTSKAPPPKFFEFLDFHPKILIRENHFQKRKVLPLQVKTTLLILGSCVIGWFPAIMLFTIMCNEGCLIQGRQVQVLSLCYKREMMIAMWLKQFFLIMKTMVNPIIYTVRMTEIQVVVLLCYKISMR